MTTGTKESPFKRTAKYETPPPNRGKRRRLLGLILGYAQLKRSLPGAVAGSFRCDVLLVATLVLRRRPLGRIPLQGGQEVAAGLADLPGGQGASQQSEAWRRRRPGKAHGAARCHVTPRGTEVAEAVACWRAAQMACRSLPLAGTVPSTGDSIGSTGPRRRGPGHPGPLGFGVGASNRRRRPCAGARRGRGRGALASGVRRGIAP